MGPSFRRAFAALALAAAILSAASGAPAAAATATDGGSAERAHQSSGWRVHVVQWGEYPYMIAYNYLGSGLRWRELVDERTGQTLRSSHIFPGQRILVPPAGSAPAPVPAETPAADGAGGPAADADATPATPAADANALGEAAFQPRAGGDPGDPYAVKMDPSLLLAIESVSSGAPAAPEPGDAPGAERETPPAADDGAGDAASEFSPGALANRVRGIADDGGATAPAAAAAIAVPLLVLMIARRRRRRAKRRAAVDEAAHEGGGDGETLAELADGDAEADGGEARREEAENAEADAAPEPDPEPDPEPEPEPEPAAEDDETEDGAAEDEVPAEDGERSGEDATSAAAAAANGHAGDLPAAAAVALAAPGRFWIGLTGPFGVWSRDDGGALEAVPSRAGANALLAFVAVTSAGGQPCARDDLGRALWPDSSADVRAMHVRRIVTRLRLALAAAGGVDASGGDPILLTRENVAFGEGMVESDAGYFLALDRQARAAADGGDSGAAIEAWRQAFALIRGPMLQDFAGSPWATVASDGFARYAHAAAARAGALARQLGAEDDAAAFERAANAAGEPAAEPSP